MPKRCALALWLALAAGPGAAALPPYPPIAPDEAERIYLERFRAMLANPSGEAASYEPMETVPGARRVRPLPVADPASRGLDAKVLAEARAVAAAANSSAFLVWRKGALVEASYFGETRRETPLVSRSLAKPLTAIAIGRAIALGHIASLDQPVADFITEWQGTPRAEMRIRHLLDMRSGLLAQGFSPEPGDPWSRAYLHPVHERIMVEDYPLTDPPGSIYEYSNVTSDLVALVIERATGMRYARFIGAEILRPIGASGGHVWVSRAGGLAHSGCCILLPAETWLRLALLLKDDGVAGGRRLLPEGYVAEMRKGTPQNPHYGLGVWVAGPYVERRGFANPARPAPKVLHSEPFLAADTFMFDGNANQIVYIVPSADLVVLRTGNPPPKQPEWDNARFLNRILRGLAPGEAELVAQK